MTIKITSLLKTGLHGSVPSGLNPPSSVYSLSHLLYFAVLIPLTLISFLSFFPLHSSFIPVLFPFFYFHLNVRNFTYSNVLNLNSLSCVEC